MTPKIPAQSWFMVCLVSIGLAGLAYPFFSQVVFSDDDGHILQLAVDAPWLAAFFDPQVYQQLSVVHYTPLVLSIYRGILTLWGPSPTAFMVLQLVLWSLCVTLAATWCQRQARQPTAGALVVLMVLGASSFWPMLVRFYTVHYLSGAVFSLGLLLLLQKPRGPGAVLVAHHPSSPTLSSQDSPLFLIGIGLLGLAAVLSKEVYLLLLPALVLSCLWQRQWDRAVALALALGVYLAMRWHVLGFSLEGRTGQGFVRDVLAIDLPIWLNFFKWYAQTHVVLLLLLAVAFWRSPVPMLMHLAVAGLLVLPVLAAPHAIREPALHADRLFFAFDLALICAVALVLHLKPWSLLWGRLLGVVLWVCAVWLAYAALVGISQKTASNVEQHITRQILAAPTQETLMVLTDVHYQQGGLMRVMRGPSAKDFSITQNCQEALTHLAHGHLLWVIDGQGKRQDPAGLSERCQAWPEPEPPVTALISPSFDNGLLKWHLQAQEGVQSGVMFPDRGMSLALTHMNQRLVRPRQDEPYRLFAHRQGQWWFSELRTMQLGAGQP
jgi:hypothetical protein